MCPPSLLASAGRVLSEPSASNGFGANEVRDRARANGVEIKDRGRVPADVVAKFRAATENKVFDPPVRIVIRLRGWADDLFS